MNNAPHSGSFLGKADTDILSAVVLQHYDQWIHSLYHGVQAIEKYLKAKFIALHESKGKNGYEVYKQNERLLKTHNVLKLWNRVESLEPSYQSFPWKDELSMLSEFDQVTRYPYVEQKVGSGLCSSDLELCLLVALQVRPNTVIQQDNYPLAMALRGYQIEEPTDVKPTPAAQILKDYFPDANALIWWPNKPPGAALVRRLPYIR
jgi:HEPN domain-containing protein